MRRTPADGKRAGSWSSLAFVGTVVSGEVGDLSLRGMSTTIGRHVALDRAYRDRLDPQQVWLFDGAASGYVKTSAPLA